MGLSSKINILMVVDLLVVVFSHAKDMWCHLDGFLYVAK
jgi:hypothetical protein